MMPDTRPRPAVEIVRRRSFRPWRQLEVRMLLLAAGLAAMLSVISPYFLTVNNLLNLLDQSVIVGIIAVGMTFVIITGGIDLSVGSVTGVTGILFGLSLLIMPIPLAMLVTLLVGAAVGLVNGVLIARFDLAAFVVTLGMMAIGRSQAYVISGANSIGDVPEALGGIVQLTVAGIPVHVIFVIAFYALAWGYLTYTKGGRTIYAIGSNVEAARHAGLNVLLYAIVPYVLSGLCAAIAAIFLAAQVLSVDPLSGNQLELDAIAPVVIGGASLFGGRGSLLGTLIGVFIMVMIRNGLNLLQVNPYYQGSAIGAIIIAAVLLERLLSQRGARR